MASLLVWKDYNCQDWINFVNGAGGTSSFSTAQMTAIRAEINKMTDAGITNDIWGTAYNMMKNLEENSLFSSGGYSVVMTQYGYSTLWGRICRVGNGFYYSFAEMGYAGLISTTGKGQFYLFQTR